MGIPGEKVEFSKIPTAQPSDDPPTAPSPETTENQPPEADKPVTFEPRKPRHTFEQIILSEKVRSEFQTLLSWIENRTLIYEVWGFGEKDLQGRSIAFNLYGPPGTGKTMCVEAIAAKRNKDIIDVSYAEIESKYVGETGKNITAAFRAAKEADALLFFDEADSILGRRMTNVTQAADQAVNVSRAVMLKQLDAFEGIVAFATNLSKNVDQAFVRRIVQHIAIPLPDSAGLTRLWQEFIPLKVPGRDELNWAKLTKAAYGFSGGDIKNAVKLGLAYTANLAPEKRWVSTEIFANAVKSVYDAKRNVGS